MGEPSIKPAGGLGFDDIPVHQPQKATNLPVHVDLVGVPKKIYNVALVKPGGLGNSNLTCTYYYCY